MQLPHIVIAECNQDVQGTRIGAQPIFSPCFVKWDRHANYKLRSNYDQTDTVRVDVAEGLTTENVGHTLASSRAKDSHLARGVIGITSISNCCN